MIIKLFKYISKKLNSVIRFITVKILKRKKGMTVIEFIYLILAEFQKTVFYKALTIIYKIVAVFIALLSLGIFYDENYKFSTLSDFTNKIIDIIIGIYKILYKTLQSILKLIFKNIYNSEEVDNEFEPYEYLKNNYVDKDYNMGQENTYHWYNDWNVIGISILILLLLGYVNKKWDSDSSIKDNILDIGVSLFLIIKSFKDSLMEIINNRNNRNNQDNDSNNDNNSDTEWSNNLNKNETINLSITPENVDPRIISDSYKYTLFKNIHDLNNWPDFNTVEHEKLLTKLMNTESRKIYHTYENLDNIIEEYSKTKEIIKSATPEELIKLEKSNEIISIHKAFNKTNEYFKNFKNTLEKDYAMDNEEFIRNRAFDLSIKNNSTTSTENETPKASSSQLSDVTPKASTSQLPDLIPKDSSDQLEKVKKRLQISAEKYKEEKEEIIRKASEKSLEKHPEWFKAEDKSFNFNIRGMFKSDKNLLSENKKPISNIVSNILNTTTDLINEDSTFEDEAEIKQDKPEIKNETPSEIKQDKPEIITDPEIVENYKLDPKSTDKPYHLHIKDGKKWLCLKEHAEYNEAKRAILLDPEKSRSMSGFLNAIKKGKIQLNEIDSEDINTYKKSDYTEKLLPKINRDEKSLTNISQNLQEVIDDKNKDKIRYIDPKNLVIMKDLDSSSTSLPSETPLVNKLSNQLDKMKMNEITEDEIKKAPSWDNDEDNHSLYNLNEVNNKDKNFNIKYKKKRIKKSTGLTKNYDPNDPDINLEKLFYNDI